MKHWTISGSKPNMKRVHVEYISKDSVSQRGAPKRSHESPVFCPAPTQVLQPHTEQSGIQRAVEEGECICCQQHPQQCQWRGSI
ncbi:hypothetical protein J4Q44_G00153830 [Coregonus suidteri]|uniref:Uncharacterized protein n=1 Tax=Coregonus suidteri TaxID=861788 RepID=A0AAN8QRS8_9TELE